MRPHRSMQAFEVFSAIASQSSGYGESLCCIENFTPLENLRNKLVADTQPLLNLRRCQDERFEADTWMRVGHKFMHSKDAPYQ
jgi:hypothetical protein